MGIGSQALTACLLLALAGCGSDPPASAPAPAPTRPPRVAEASGAPPDFDARLAAQVPADAFLYAAVRGMAWDRLVAAWFPEAELPVPAGAAPGLAGWLRALRSAAPAAAWAGGPFSGSVAVGVGAGSRRPEDGVVLAYWLAAEATPALEAAVAALGAGGTRGRFSPPGSGTVETVLRDGIRIFSARPEWLEAPAAPPVWIAAARTGLPGRAIGFAALSPAAYQQALGPVLASRAPAEVQLTGQVVQAVHLVGAAVEDLGTRLRVRARAQLDGRQPEAQAWLTRLAPRHPLAGLGRVPAVARAYLGGSLDWAALLPALPSPPPAPPTPAAAPGDPAALAGGMLPGLLETLRGWLVDWAGPELALVVGWDAREPEAALLVEAREPKRAAAFLQRFHQSEAGARLRFVDGTAHGLPYRWTRLDGVDPRWLEPAYGFVGPFLTMATRRRLFETVADPGGEKIDARDAVGGVQAALGERMSAIAWLDTELLTRLAELGRKPGDPAPGPAAGTPSPWGAASGLALGVGTEPGAAVEAALLVVRPDTTGEDPVGSGPEPGAIDSVPEPRPR